jgi:hypothetical protein
MTLKQAVIWRLIRTALAMALATAAAWASHDPRWVWLAPVITALGKWLRDKYGLKIPL